MYLYPVWSMDQWYVGLDWPGALYFTATMHALFDVLFSVVDDEKDENGEGRKYFLLSAIKVFLLV